MQPYSAQDYAAQLAALLPQGAAWPREADTVLAALLQGLAVEPARVDAALHDLLTELDPPQALELLADWERVCGLPDGCSQPGETVQERREAVALRLSAQGGQTPAYFAEVATLLAGAPCIVREFRPLRVGSRAGDLLSNGDWPFAFSVQAPEVPIRTMKAGQGCAGERLRTWGNERLECTVRRLAPAHTIVTFTYGA
ncbi:MAG: YmfQ family protein [Proteobacteria bacterium]|nr:YmfQ family protein [Pseudomonadota bacterium]MBU1594273.1 YmfQ family protein [Pseudomonadota bacterium]